MLYWYYQPFGTRGGWFGGAAKSVLAGCLTRGFILLDRLRDAPINMFFVQVDRALELLDYPVALRYF